MNEHPVEEHAAVAFVAGASGYTGRHVVRSLTERSVSAVAHVRPESPHLAEVRPLFEGLGAQVDTSPWELSELSEALARLRPTHLFCLIGTTRAGMRSERRRDPQARASYEAIDEGLTALLIDAARGTGLRPKVVYLSALGVGPRSRSPYYRARWRAEETVRGSGLPHLIVRAPLISGPDRSEARTAERLAASLVNGALRGADLLGAHRLRARYRSMTGAELGQALVACGLGDSEGVLLPDSLRTS